MMESIHKELLAEMTGAIKDTICEDKIGIAFSGGVDSTLVARICSNIGYDISLLTVGFANSYDIESARQANQYLGMPHHVLEITRSSFDDVAARIMAAVGDRSLSWIENCIAFHYITKLARLQDIPVVVTANGIDELFCGYDAYRRVVSGGEQAVMDMIDEKVAHEQDMLISAGSLSAANRVRVVQPLLSEGFVRYARALPLMYKITGSDDLMRKHIIRDLARVVGVSEFSAGRRKKALQYGSAIHKTLVKFIKSSNA